MSYPYWQQAVASEPAASQNSPNTQSMWDYIPLGGPATAPTTTQQSNYQWGQYAQQNNQVQSHAPTGNTYESSTDQYSTPNLYSSNNQGQYNNTNGMDYQQSDPSYQQYQQQPQPTPMVAADYSRTIEHTPIIPAKKEVLEQCVPNGHSGVQYDHSQYDNTSVTMDGWGEGAEEERRRKSDTIESSFTNGSRSEETPIPEVRYSSEVSTHAPSVSESHSEHSALHGYTEQQNMHQQQPQHGQEHSHEQYQHHQPQEQYQQEQYQQPQQCTQPEQTTQEEPTWNNWGDAVNGVAVEMNMDDPTEYNQTLSEPIHDIHSHSDAASSRDISQEPFHNDVEHAEEVVESPTVEVPPASPVPVQQDIVVDHVTVSPKEVTPVTESSHETTPSAPPLELSPPRIDPPVSSIINHQPSPSEVAVEHSIPTALTVDDTPDPVRSTGSTLDGFETLSVSSQMGNPELFPTAKEDLSRTNPLFAWRDAEPSQKQELTERVLATAEAPTMPEAIRGLSISSERRSTTADEGLLGSAPRPEHHKEQQQLYRQQQELQRQQQKHDGYYHVGAKGRFADLQEQDVSDSASSSLPPPRKQREDIFATYESVRKRLPTLLSKSNRAPLPLSGSVRGGISNPLYEEGRRSVTGRYLPTPSGVSTRHSNQQYQSPGQPQSQSRQSNGFGEDRLNSSLLTNPDVPFDMQFESPQSGEGFVESTRRSRLYRSQMGSRGPVVHPTQPETYDQRMARGQQHGQFDRNATGRRSAIGYSEHNHHHMHEQHHQSHRRRPQSSFDARAQQRMERSGVPMEQYDVYNAPGMSSDSGDGGDGSDAEMAQYNSQTPFFSEAEIYLIGSLRVHLTKFINTVRKFPPPPAYYRLRPIERVAYVFYTALWQHNYGDVNLFSKKFNRDFFTLTAAGVEDEEALYEICTRLQTQYMDVRKQQYTNTQKQLFSDERDSHDEEERQSERGSVDHGEEDDLASIDPSSRAPYKFRYLHAFATFGAGGKMLVLNAKSSPSMIEIHEIGKVLNDERSLRIARVVDMYRGPLNMQTPHHSVTLYIRRQIENIANSDVAKENPNAHDVTDCLLLWQLLLIVVQQHGKVTGPDIAHLLIASERWKREQPEMGGHREHSATPVRQSQTTDPRVHERFTSYLLEGHIHEAIDLALREGLYADALVLARRVDPARLPDIEEKYISSMSQQNPVATLMAVANYQPAPVLLNPPTDDGSWRAHVAIVLANLNSQPALSTVYSLGKVLAEREYHAAADFCMLSVALLTSWDPFKAPAEPERSGRQHIALIHASLPDDPESDTMCRYGFSLTDLHATEIFSYGVALAKSGVSELQSSIEYQCSRIQYAKLLAELGFTKMAFMYCVDVAQQIWSFHQSMPTNALYELCDTAERMQCLAEATPDMIPWIATLRGMIDVAPHVQDLPPQPQPQPHQHHEQQTVTEHVPSTTSTHQEPIPQPEIPQSPPMEDYQTPPYNQTSSQPDSPAYDSRARASSISSEAADWHSGHQEPLTFRHQSEERRNSVSSQHSHQPVIDRNAYQSYPQSVQEAQESSTEPSDEGNTNSSAETTPAHKPYPTMPELPPMQPMTFKQPQHQMAPQMQSQSLPQVQHQQQQYVSKSVPAPTKEPSPATDRLTASVPEPGEMKKSSSGSGKWLMERLRKVMPLGNEMKLPDDNKKSIVWDPVLNKYVGEGIEDEPVAAPPPAAMMCAPVQTVQPNPTSPTQSAPSALRDLRASGGSRYKNSLNLHAGTSSAATPQPFAGGMPPANFPMPQSFGFIPSQPEIEDAGDSPFSQGAGDPSTEVPQDAN